MSEQAMRLVAAVAVVAGCSSSSPAPTPPPAPPIAVAVPVQTVAAFQASAPVAERVAAFSLTASDGSGLRLTSVEAKAVVEGPLAFTELHLTFHNGEDRIREGTFSITLPSRAAISRFAMEEFGRMKEAEVVEKAVARRAYDDFLHRRIDPALLEKAPGNQFTARVFPIPARSDKHLVISYSQELTNEGYTLPLRGLPQIDRIAVTLDTTTPDGARRRESLQKTAWLPDRDFVATVVSTPAVGDGLLVAGAFDVVPSFTDVALERGVDRPARVTLLVDTSASRALGFATYLTRVRAVAGALAARYESALVVTAFDQDAQVVFGGAARGFGDREVEMLLDRGPGGASDLSRIAPLATGRVVIVTDGVATAGLEGAALAKRFAGAERVDVVLAGGIRDEQTALSLARAGKRSGDVFDLDRESPDAIARGLGETIQTNVRVDVANAAWVYPATLPSVRSGTQVMVFAKLRAPAQTIDVSIGGNKRSARLGRATPALLQRAVARAEIEELEATIALHTDSEITGKLRQAIRKKSVAARVVSGETSMIVLDTEEDYELYDIDRRALADILVVGPKGLEQLKRTNYVAAKKRFEPPAHPLTREEAIEQARNAGVLATPMHSGEAFASLTDTGDISSGFDAGTESGGIVGFGRASSQVRYPMNMRASGQGVSAGSGRGQMRGRVATAPTVSIGAPMVMGSLDKTVIKRYIKRHISQVAYCYEKELLGRPNLEGTVRTSFLIAAGGRVQAVTAEGVDEKVSTCIADVIKRIEFPTVTEGSVQVNYPFVFKIAGRHEQPAIPDVPLGTEPAPTQVTQPEPPPPPPAPPKPEPLGAPAIDALDGKLQTVMRAIAKKQDALGIAKAWRREQPGDVLAWIALGEALEAAGDKTGAARAYGSIIDLFGARAEYRRFAGERLERTGVRWLAVDTYRRAVADRPDQLTGHRLLAFALLRDGDHAGAFAAMLKGVEQNAPVDRYAGAPKLFARDAGMIGAAYVAAHPDKRADVMKQLATHELALVTRPATRVLLYWETDANDVDLHIRDAQGNHAYYSAKELPTGGELYADVTTGFGPECIEIPGKPTAGPYELAVHYYAQGPMGYGMGLLQIERFDGKRFTFEDRPYVIMRDQAMIALGRLR